MGKEYQFAVKKCVTCGLKLSGKRVELEGMKGPLFMGRCPKCGTAYPLVEPEPAEPEAEAETEPGAEAGKMPPNF